MSGNDNMFCQFIKLTKEGMKKEPKKARQNTHLKFGKFLHEFRIFPNSSKLDHLVILLEPRNK